MVIQVQARSQVSLPYLIHHMADASYGLTDLSRQPKGNRQTQSTPEQQQRTRFD
jgi:hypothetical protein